MTVKEMLEFLHDIEQDVQIFLGGDMGISPLTQGNIGFSKASSHFITPPEGIKAGEKIIVFGDRK